MKTDRLEEFIRANREAFDELAPSPEVWDKIARNTRKKNKRYAGTFLMKVAAIVVFIVAFSALLLKNKGVIFYNESAQNIDPEIVELIEAEAYYAGQVNRKMEEIEKCYNTYPEIKEDVEADLKELQEMYDTLKTDLNENISKKEVIEAMIENNRYRLKLVDDVLEQINC